LDLSLLYVILLAVSVVTAAWYLRKHPLGYILLPTILVGTLLSGNEYVKRLGKPLTSYPIGEYTYLHHTMTTGEIVLWVTGEKGNRLYKFPYSREVAKKLGEAQKKSQNGDPQNIKATKNRGGYEIEIKDSPPENVEETK
jgi:hypothetical protein